MRNAANLRICKNLQLMAYVLVPARVFTSATQPCSMEVDTRRLVTMPKKKNVCSQHHSLSQQCLNEGVGADDRGLCSRAEQHGTPCGKHARQLTI